MLGRRSWLVAVTLAGLVSMAAAFTPQGASAEVERPEVQAVPIVELAEIPDPGPLVARSAAGGGDGGALMQAPASLSASRVALDEAPTVYMDGTSFRVIPLKVTFDSETSSTTLVPAYANTTNAQAGCSGQRYYYSNFYYRWEYGGNPGDPYDLHVYRYLMRNQCAYYWYIGEPLYTAMALAGKFPPSYSFATDVNGTWRARINIGLSVLHGQGRVRELTSQKAAEITRIVWSPWQ